MGNSLKQLFTAKNAWPAVIIVFFLVVYLFSLTFVSVDGDHAASLTYHIVGRDHDVMRPYFFYHGMMDVMVSAVPAQYESLETVPLLITAIAMILLVISILALVFGWLKQLNIDIKHRWLFALIILLASPEYFFLGLVLTLLRLLCCWWCWHICFCDSR